MGSSFKTDDSASFTYVSDAFATGAESVTFTVTDSIGTSKSASFGFNVLPQAPFSSPSGGLRPGQLGVVMEQWSLASGSKVNCLLGCHSPGGISVDRMNLSQSANAVYDALINGTSNDGNGGPRVVAPAERQSHPENSWILCFPSSGCPVEPIGAPHDGGAAMPETSPSYGVIKRWIQEGALQN
jgi:hypothetical protein